MFTFVRQAEWIHLAILNQRATGRCQQICVFISHKREDTVSIFRTQWLIYERYSFSIYDKNWTKYINDSKKKIIEMQIPVWIHKEVQSFVILVWFVLLARCKIWTRFPDLPGQSWRWDTIRRSSDMSLSIHLYILRVRGCSGFTQNEVLPRFINCHILRSWILVIILLAACLPWPSTVISFTRTAWLLAKSLEGPGAAMMIASPSAT